MACPVDLRSPLLSGGASDAVRSAREVAGLSRTTVVVGAGITGLVAARNLAAAGHDVTVVDRAPTPGGQIRTVELVGHAVDVGAEALHVAGPHVTDLLHDLRVDGRTVTADTSWTWIWTRRGLRRLPAGVGPAGPTRLSPLVRSGLLGPAGVARAALEPLVPRQELVGDISVGAFLRRRFGHRVVQRLVDPLVGSLHAGDVSRLSLRSATPYLEATARRHRSLVLAPRPPAPVGPSFVSFDRGLRVLVDALLDESAATVRVGVGVRAVRGNGTGYEVELDDGGVLGADAVVLAVPAAEAAAVLGAGDRRAAAAALTEMRAASVATVVAAYPRSLVGQNRTFAATGILVPSTDGRFLKAATFLSRKWPHLRDPDRFLVRMSAGRIGGDDVTALSDAELVDRLHADLAAATGIRAEPDEVVVQRWPRTMAQMEVGHSERMEVIRAASSEGGPVALAGAPYDGVGLASCITAGRVAAARIEELTPMKVAT